MCLKRYNQLVILERYNGEFSRMKEESMKEQNIGNCIPLHCYDKARSTTEMHNSHYMSIKKIKNE